MEPEPGSLGDLLREDHIHMVWRAFRRRLGHAELAWDATGMLFERVSKRFEERYDPRRGSFEGWLLSFVEFVAREVWRSEHRHLPLEAFDAQAGFRHGNDIPPEPFPDLPRDLRTEIEALAPRDRRILALKVEGWPSIAIAERLGMTPILNWLRGEPLPGAPDELVWPILTQAQLDGLPEVAPRRRVVARALRLTRLVSGGRP